MTARSRMLRSWGHRMSCLDHRMLPAASIHHFRCAMGLGIDTMPIFPQSLIDRMYHFALSDHFGSNNINRTLGARIVHSIWVYSGHILHVNPRKTMMPTTKHHPSLGSTGRIRFLHAYPSLPQIAPNRIRATLKPMVSDRVETSSQSRNNCNSGSAGSSEGEVVG